EIFQDHFDQYQAKLDKLEEAKKRSEHYKWLENAGEFYQSQFAQISRRPGLLSAIPVLAMAVLAGAFALFKIPLGIIIALAAIVLYFFFILRRIQGRPQKNEELEKLKREFKSRFQTELTGYPQMKMLLQEIGEDYIECGLLKKQTDEDESDLKLLKGKITRDVDDLSGEHVDPQFWKDRIGRFHKNLQELKKILGDKEKDWARLDVDPSDYQQEKPDVEYSLKHFKELDEKFKSKKEELDSENKKLEKLKQQICVQTGDEITADWDTLIQHVRNKREDILKENKSATASIIGKILVHQVLEDLRQDENKIILDGLQSDHIIKPLKQITKRYNHLRLEDDRLVVSDDYNPFFLSDLSTGAQEQVLLALRIGFASKLLGKESLFLILDDAFQYSDWERREWLMNMMVDLAQNGWQIIYFTMDDHIKKLFESKGKRFGDQFKMCMLKESNE
ncbi:hypothetical protein MUP95_05540, partial [bacterium]|nr:hypothetical protein [bacterium]